MTKKTLVNSYFFTYTAILVVMLIAQMVKGYSKESWNITEFLINYQGGFVRRGLLGELLLLLHNAWGISPYAAVLGLCLGAYGALVWFFVRSFIKHGYTLFIVPFVFFLGNPIVGNFWVRKDALIILLFVAILSCALKEQKRYVVFVNLLFSLALLIHEAIGFFCFPILMLILLTNNSAAAPCKPPLMKRLLGAFLKSAPAGAVFAVVLYCKGSPKIARQIWDSWKPVPFPFQSGDDHQLPGAIDAISWSFRQGLELFRDTLRNFNDFFYAPLMWAMILLCIYYVLTNASKLNRPLANYQPRTNFVKTHLSAVLIFQLLTILPLFVLGWDYGRWVFYWVASSFAIIVLVPQKQLSVLFPSLLIKTGEKINALLSSVLGDSHVLVLCVLIGFPPFSWDLLSCVKASSVAIIAQFFSRLLYSAFVVVDKVF